MGGRHRRFRRHVDPWKAAVLLWFGVAPLLVYLIPVLVVTWLSIWHVLAQIALYVYFTAWAALLTGTLAAILVHRIRGNNLHYAARSGQVEWVEEQLEHGASPNVCTLIGQTPLHLAAMQGHAKIVRLLLQHGARQDLKDRRGATAYELALAGGHDEVCQLLSGAINDGS